MLQVHNQKHRNSNKDSLYIEQINYDEITKIYSDLIFQIVGLKTLILLKTINTHCK